MLQVLNYTEKHDQLPVLLSELNSFLFRNTVIKQT